MRRIYLALSVVSGIGALMWAADWAGPGPQRDAWARGESGIGKENAKDLKLLWKLKIDNQSKGPDALTPGVILGRQITYRGFKEMLIVGGSSDNLINIDADLGRLIWKTHFEYKGNRPAPCAGGLVASPAMPPPPMRGGTTGPAPAAPPSGRGLLGRGGTGFGALQRIWVVSSDGMLHTVNSHTGADIEPPLAFVPANARVDSLNIAGNMLYATTSGSCSGAPNGVYAIDLTDDGKQVKSFVANGALGLARGGVAVGGDGTVYVQSSDSLAALSSGDLKLKDYFTGASTVIPVIFHFKERELIVMAGGDGRLYLLDAASLGGPDHKTPLYRTEPVAGTAFASWEDEATGTRWIYASVASPKGGIAAFEIVERDGHVELSPAWTSRDMVKPGPPVVANGTVFVLSTGESAKLYVLDADTGKELYSSANAVASATHNGGLALANGRVYFGTDDNYVYSFGFPIEH